jgi:hypothetical protein
MKSFSELSQQVWMTPSVVEKKQILLEMVNNFKYKGKFNENVGRFTREIERCNSAKMLDSMAAKLALNDTDKVVK